MQNMITAVFDSREANMQDMNIYIVIGDPNDARRSATIKGNFEVLRAFLSGVGNFKMQDPAPTSSPFHIEAQPIPHKRNKRKETLSATTAA
jgi:hypothetical protein